MTERVYIVEPPRDAYEVEDRDPTYDVTHDESERVELRDAVILTLPGDPGPPGPPGPPGSADVIAQEVETYDVTHPKNYEWTSPGAVTVVDFDHPLTFKPNVELIDSAGTTYLVSPIITPGHIHIDLGGALMSVSVILS